MKVYDADSHVWEGEHTFSDRYWDPRFKGRRPIVVESDPMGNLSFIIDGRAFPRPNGPFSAAGGNPVSKNGVPSPFFKQLVASSAKKGFVDTLESAEFHTAKARLDQMDREDVLVEVNYPSMLLTWPLTYDSDLACAIASAYNSWMADVSGQAPGRLKWVSVIEPSNVSWSCKEIERCKELGAIAVMILGTVGDTQWDHPSLEPIFTTAAACDLPIAVHIGYSSPALGSLYTHHFNASTIPFSFSLLLGFHSIMCSGLFDRYPNLRVGFLESGSRWVDFLAKRIGENSGLVESRTSGNLRSRSAPVDEASIGGSGLFRPGGYNAELLPEEYIKRGQIFVNCEIDENQLPFIIKEYGEDFLIFASDIPHGHRLVDPVGKLTARTDITEVAKRKIAIDNVARFYGLPVPVLEPAATAAG